MEFTVWVLKGNGATETVADRVSSVDAEAIAADYRARYGVRTAVLPSFCSAHVAEGVAR
jgi:hypothetical protein